MVLDQRDVHQAGPALTENLHHYHWDAQPKAATLLEHVLSTVTHGDIVRDSHLLIPGCS